jgi:hypothetical protein
MSDTGAARMEHFVNRSGEIHNPRARYDDRVPTPVRFLGDPEKFSPIVLPIFHVKTLSFDLELFRVDDAVHFFPKNGAV